MLDSRSVSRLHALIQRKDAGDLALVDLGRAASITVQAAESDDGGGAVLHGSVPEAWAPSGRRTTRCSAGRSLGQALYRLLPLPARAVVVPVPLHVTRLRERGYNQALLLARGLGRRARLPVAPRALVRRRPTPSQAHLDAAARRENLAGAFIATAAVHAPTVILVDDVLTTGATADACARALRGAGATRIIVLTVGRTP
jgi:ComF family protein